tara:strand:+ start:178 stop:336 length:159 start_codon:yes stop_codon:yes gene_type:complete
MIKLAKFDGIKGERLNAVEVKDDEITLIFADNRYVFVTAVGNDQMEITSLPE